MDLLVGNVMDAVDDIEGIDDSCLHINRCRWLLSRVLVIHKVICRRALRGSFSRNRKHS